MVFSSFGFLFMYLPAVLIAYYLTPRKFQNVTLLLSSLAFFLWGSPTFIVTLIISAIVDFSLASLALASGPHKHRRYIALGVALNVLMLFYYKYSNFFIDQTTASGLMSVDWAPVILPIGISFLTFHKISYLVDVSRKTTRAAESFIDYLLYLTLFPHLIAGPIVRYHDIADQLHERRTTIDGFYSGVVRFCFGLAKKVLIADSLAGSADRLFSLPADQLPTAYAWLGIITYSFQIYFDFSGYSDMAIGLAAMFGFKFPENFNNPYRSRNMSEFWKRWHMSLSRWMRDYLYIPLGGNRTTALRMSINLWIVFLISGLWHGASWNFVLWGLFHGIFLSIDKLGYERISNSVSPFISIAVNCFVIGLSWVIFRTNSLEHAGYFYSSLFGETTLNPEKPSYMLAQVISERGWWALGIAFLITFVDFSRLKSLVIPGSAHGARSWTATGAIILFILSILTIATQRYSPFIYFQF